MKEHKKLGTKSDMPYLLNHPKISFCGLELSQVIRSKGNCGIACDTQLPHFEVFVMKVALFFLCTTDVD